MSSVRTFQLDELALRPGTYFNAQTEIMIVVDDSADVDHELFEAHELEDSDWVLIGEDVPVDELRRDELVERFERAHHDGADLTGLEADEDDKGDEEDEEEDGEELDELELDPDPE